MMSLKIVLVLYLVLLVGLIKSTPVDSDVPSVRAGSHSLIECKDMNNNQDEVIYTQKYSRKVPFWQVIQERLIFPEYGLSKNVISCIKIIDLVPNNKGGYCRIVSGGIGFTFVELEFTSQRSYNMEFNVEVFGAPAKAATTATP